MTREVLEKRLSKLSDEDVHTLNQVCGLINEINDDFEEQLKQKDKEIEELKKCCHEAVQLPKGVEPHKWSDYKFERQE